VMPEHGESGGAITGASVVNVQYASIIQRKVGLCHHVPSLMTSAQAVLAGGALSSRPAGGRAVAGGPRTASAKI
jgi:hypothetical protein